MNKVLKWINIAKSDIESSRILHKNKYYSQSYFYFQQATEKGNKANWMLNDLLNESELKSIGHNQFKPLRKNLIVRKNDIDYLNSLEDKIDFINESPLLKSIDIEEYKDNLENGIKFIDNLRNKNLLEFQESELIEMLTTLEELKNTEIKLPLDFSTTARTITIEHIDWLKKINSKKALEEAKELLDILSNDEEYEKFYHTIQQVLDALITLTYTSNTLLFCSILTVQHSNSTRYPQELEGQSPLDYYNENLNIIMKQNLFLDYLDDTMKKLADLSVNYQTKDSKSIEKEQSFKINYNPDSRWEIFGIKSKTEFHKQFLIQKNVHKEVPENIVKELEIAEQLQSLSYFHYPLYGDAFSRLSRIFEMAIKAKAKTLGFNTNNKPLVKLIDLVSEGYSELYKLRLDWARKMRNMNAHPDTTTFYGNILKLPLIRLTNIINDIFKQKEFFEREKECLQIVQKKYKYLKNGLWILDNLLIHSVDILATYEDFSLWAFYPVRETYPQNDNEQLYVLEPIYAIIKHHQIEEGGLTSKNINDGIIELIETTSKENIRKLNYYEDLLNSSEEGTKRSMETSTNHSIDYQIENFYNIISSFL